jgi:hypothetical protein
MGVHLTGRGASKKSLPTVDPRKMTHAKLLYGRFSVPKFPTTADLGSASASYVPTRKWCKAVAEHDSVRESTYKNRRSACGPFPIFILPNYSQGIEPW